MSSVGWRGPNIVKEGLLIYIAQGIIYNRVLTPTEILQNFNATRSRFGV